MTAPTLPEGFRPSRDQQPPLSDLVRVRGKHAREADTGDLKALADRVAAFALTEAIPAPGLLSRLTGGFAVLRASRHAVLGPESGPFTGSRTSAQAMGMRHLELIAEGQNPAVPVPAARRRLRAPGLSLRAVPWPLLPVLAVQAVLSLRLTWSNSAFIDEATYLYAGSQELAHWTAGIPVEDYQRFFSGSPAVYPPLGAVASAIGGLAGARLLSLAFMLAATVLLWSMSRRLFGPWAATAGTALFAGLAGTQFLGALATYDAMALFLLALPAWLAIGREHAGTLTHSASATVIAGAVLALANACKYATALWDPVVIGLALCAAPLAGQPWRRGLWDALRLAASLVALLAAGLAVGKAKYVQGILYTTLNRSPAQPGMGKPAALVLHDAWSWAGWMLALAALGALLLLAGRTPFPRAARGAALLLGALLLLAAVAAPLNQARIGTAVSLQKHVVFGAWFGCVLAGHAVTRLLRWRPLIAVACALILVPLAAVNAETAARYVNWPAESPAFTAALRRYVHPGAQRYLISGYADIPAYYVGSVSSLQWKEAGAFTYRDPGTGRILAGAAAFAVAIRSRYFTLVILDFGYDSAGEPAADHLIAADISRYKTYKAIGHLPPSSASSLDYYTVWQVTG